MRLNFADAVFDLGTREILRRGSQVPISPKAFQFLGATTDLRERELRD
jgi:DNA-binding winged helix-turn-helix (wHTH) protein